VKVETDYIQIASVPNGANTYTTSMYDCTVILHDLPASTTFATNSVVFNIHDHKTAVGVAECMDDSRHIDACMRDLSKSMLKQAGG